VGWPANSDRLQYPRGMGRAEILKAALELPAAEREQLADDLWASLHGETEAEVEQAWATEIEHRIDEADKHIVKSVPWSEVRSEALDAVRRVRGG
jgi:putative addiction module component (TIGR02574 family)